jgi:hypothetical protein
MFSVDAPMSALGQTRPSQLAAMQTDVRYAPIATDRGNAADDAKGQKQTLRRTKRKAAEASERWFYIVTPQAIRAPPPPNGAG